jgi:hypothetical protein
MATTMDSEIAYEGQKQGWKRQTCCCPSLSSSFMPISPHCAINCPLLAMYQPYKGKEVL